MDKFLTIVILLILVWGSYPISSFYQNKKEVEDCAIISTFNFDFEIALYISVYSTFLFSISFVFSILKKTNDFFTAMFISIFFVLNIGTGFLLFVSLTMPDSSFRKCSNNIISIICFTSLFTEIIIFSLLILSLTFSIGLLDLIFKLFKEYIILPLIHRNIQKISLFFLIAWNGLLIWSLIYVYENVIVALGILQIFFVFSSLILLKLKRIDYFKFNINVVIILGITIYFLQVFNSKYGLTTFGIISFLSIGFYPMYFIMKRSKKIYKKYMTNRLLLHNMMPKEPPAIYASGEIYNYFIKINMVLETTECIPINNGSITYTDCMEFSLLRFLQLLLYDPRQIGKDGFSFYPNMEGLIKTHIKKYGKIY